MVIGQRLKKIREEKGLSQGDIENKTGMLRCYISRVENGHTVPSLETVERFAAALDVPVYELFYDGDVGPLTPRLSSPIKPDESGGETQPSLQDERFLRKLLSVIVGMRERDRQLLLTIAGRISMAGQS